MRRAITLVGSFLGSAVLGAGLLVLSAPDGTAGTAGAITCFGKPATIVGGNHPQISEYLVGTPGADVIAGLAGSDMIHGMGGNDLICGGGGKDRIYGGAGHDRIRGGSNERPYAPWDPNDSEWEGDFLVGGPGDDHLDTGRPVRTDARGTSEETIFYATAPRGVKIDVPARTVTGHGRDTIVWYPGLDWVGSRHDDHFIGSTSAERVSAHEGDDHLQMRGGSDTITEWVAPDRSGDDFYDAGAGDDYVWPSSGADEVHGGEGADELSGGGPDTLRVFAGGGDDQVHLWMRARAEGLQGTRLVGGDGVDLLRLGMDMGKPADRALQVTVNPAARRLTVLDGATRQLAALERFERYVQRATYRQWRFVGSDLGETYAVEQGRVDARGNGGDDVLIGNAGNDVLGGGPGQDTLDGAYGTDTCTSGEIVTNCER